MTHPADGDHPASHAPVDSPAEVTVTANEGDRESSPWGSSRWGSSRWASSRWVGRVLRRSRFGLLDAAREGFSNVRAGRAAAMGVAVLNLVIGLVVASTAISSADRAVEETDALHLRGRHMLRYSVLGGSVDMELCDRVQTLEGVTAAGGILLRERVVLGNGARVPIQEVSGGMARLLGIETAPEAGTVFAGALAARRNGLLDRTWVTYRQAQEAPATASVRLVPETPRSARLDDSLLIVVAPTGAADECWIEVEPPRAAAVAQAIPALSESAGLLVEFNPALRESDPERDLREVPRSPLTPVGGLAAATVLGMWWYSRRQEWVLYRVFGLGVVRRMAVAGAEWGLVTALPMVAGASWAVIATAPADRRAVVLGWSAAAVAVALSGTVVAVWGAISSRPRPSTVLKGG